MRTIERLLVANRGEIARRVMRTCRELGINTVAVYSDADAGAAFVADADLAVGLGGNTPAESYLRVDAIIDAAKRTGADAIHPGYGFLAENEAFARAVTDAGLIFVGPTPEVISVMGSKLESKRLMAAAGVPLLPSAELTDLSPGEVQAAANEIGYPVLIKASAGGGGRGMRIVHAESALADAVAGAAREAESAFGDGTIYAERYVAPSRHIEVQIFGDESGRVVHFHERECSIQRRHQKIIEEAPSASIDDATRAALHDAAVQAGKAIGYTNAGTVEFLVGPPPGDGGPPDFYFLEVNTRLQVEHPVTEAVLGADLVKLQLSVACGGSVPEQSDIGPVSGHAVEARLYAEDPMTDFLPSTGTVRAFSVPGPVRLDTAIDPDSGRDGEAAGEVSQYYDPMIAKVIAHGPDRGVACRVLAASLAGAVVDGIVTNRELLVRTLQHPEFLGDQGDSEFLVRNRADHLGRPLLEGDPLAMTAGAAVLAIQAVNRTMDRHTAAVSSGFRNVATGPQQVSLGRRDQQLVIGYRLSRGRLVELLVDGQPLADPVLHAVSATAVDLTVDGIRRRFSVSHAGEGADRTVSVAGPHGAETFTVLPRFAEPSSAAEAGSTVAAMPGTIIAVAVEPGAEVAAGDTLLVMEAMKMELAVAASTAGTVTSVPVSVGDSVEAGQVLAVVEEF
ncbi:MAG: biotin carboxylase N-terminal domain-containing protein [Actinomycetota bacterium]